MTAAGDDPPCAAGAAATRNDGPDQQQSPAFGRACLITADRMVTTCEQLYRQISARR